MKEHKLESTILQNGIVIKDSIRVVILGCLLAVLMGGIGVMLIRSGEYIPSLFAAALMFAGAIGTCDFGKTAITVDGIERKSLFFKGKILWSEIDIAKMNRPGTFICLVADNKRLRISGPESIGKSEDDKLFILRDVMQEKSIEFILSEKPIMLLNKNVRVSKLDYI